MDYSKNSIQNFDELISKVGNVNSKKSSQKTKYDVLKKYEIINNEKKRNAFKSISYLIKMMSNKSAKGRQELRNFLYLERGVKISFLNGLKSFISEKREETQNLILISLIALAYSPMMAVKLSWAFLPNVWLFNISCVTLGILFPIFCTYYMFREKVRDHCLGEEINNFIQKKIPDEYIEQGINKADFLYQTERTQNEEKNIKILDKIVEMEKKSWAAHGIRDNLTLEMAIRYKYSIKELLTEEVIADLNKKSFDIKQYRNDL